MNTLIKNIILSSCLSVLLCCGLACKKGYLEIVPKGMVILTDLVDYDHLLNNLGLVNTSVDALVPLGDDVMATDPYFSGAALRTQRLFKYEDNIYDPSQEAAETKSIMPQIYTFNKIINEVMDAKTGSAEQKRSLLSEAKAGRAWCFFMLINYYGKPYNASTAKTDPGFPIVVTADVTKTDFQRGSVQEMYDQIINDLKSSIPFISNNQTSNVRMTKCAAEVLLAKVLMFTGNYQEALPYLRIASSELPPVLGSKLADLNVVLLPGGAWGYNPVTSPTRYTFSIPNAWDDQENIYAKQIVNLWTYNSSELLMTKETGDLFGASDQRLKFFSKQPYGGGSYPNAPMALRRVGPISSGVGITVPDLYLLRAECEARTGDLAGARSTLLAFRKSRMPEGDAAVNITDPTTLIKFVIQERQREFALKGYRWFDMRRLSLDPLFSADRYNHTYIDKNGVTTLYALKPERLTLRIPAKVLLENPQMSDNP